VIRALAAGEPLLTYFKTAVPFAEPAVLDIAAASEAYDGHSKS
jgi:hypothetical protein